MTSMRRNSTMDLENASLDKIHVECESASIIPPDISCYVASSSPSAGGSGLDSDFGASAGQFCDLMYSKVQPMSLRLYNWSTTAQQFRIRTIFNAFERSLLFLTIELFSILMYFQMQSILVKDDFF